MGAIFAERVLGVADPRVALLSIGEEKGKGDARIQRATGCSTRPTLRFVGNVEGKDLTRHLADVVVTRRGRRQRRDQVLRGPVDLHLRPVADRVPAAPGAGRLALPADAPGHRPHPRRVRLRDAPGGSPLLGVKGTVIITHGRAKRRMIGYACEVAATTARTRGSRSSSPRRCRGRRQRRCWRPHGRRRPSRGGRHMSGPELTVGQGVIAELVSLAAFEVPGVARVGHGGPSWRGWLAGPAVRVRVRRRSRPRPPADRRPARSAARTAGRPGPDGRRRDRRALARARPRGRDGHRRWRRRLTSSADVGRDADSRWRPSSRPTSASAPPTPSSSATWPSPSATRSAATLARELVAAVTPHRAEIDAAIDPRRTPLPGHRPRQDGPRAAPNGHR